MKIKKLHTFVFQDLHLSHYDFKYQSYIGKEKIDNFLYKQDNWYKLSKCADLLNDCDDVDVIAACVGTKNKKQNKQKKT